MIGRSIPEKETGNIGLFEFDQAKALQENTNNQILYGFVDNRSIKVLRKFSIFNKSIENVPVYGVFLPIGGLYKPLFDEIKFILFRKMFKKIEKKYGLIDIVHVHYPVMLLNNRILSFLEEKDIKIVVTEHWSKVQSNNLTVREENILESVCQTSNSIIAVSQNLKESIVTYCPFSRPKINVIPNLISNNYKIQKRNDDDFFTFVTIGRLVPIKNNIEVLKAFKKVNSVYENTRLYIVGDGEEKENLSGYVKQNSLEKSVLFTGFLDSQDINLLFKKIDVYISASVIETFGVPVVESWFSGRPVIIRDKHPLSRYITDENGSIYKQSNELSIKMLNCIKENFNYDVITEISRGIFSKESIINNIQNVYK